jgi:hypothetical protein
MAKLGLKLTAVAAVCALASTSALVKPTEARDRGVGGFVAGAIVGGLVAGAIVKGAEDEGKSKAPKKKPVATPKKVVAPTKTDAASPQVKTPPVHDTRAGSGEPPARPARPEVAPVGLGSSPDLSGDGRRDGGQSSH